MKLPTSNEKFIVMKDSCAVSCYRGFVVSGVHIEIRADDNRPDFVWYCVYADKVYDDLYRGGCLYVALCLDHALDFIAQYLTLYQEQEEKSDEGSDEEPTAEAVDSDDHEVVSENVASGSDICDDDSSGSAVQLFGSGNACGISSEFSDKIPRDCVIPEAAAALDHMFDSFNSLATDLLHMQYILTPAPTGGGGAAAYA